MDRLGHMFLNALRKSFDEHYVPFSDDNSDNAAAIAGYIDRHGIQPGVWEDAVLFLPIAANVIIARLRQDAKSDDIVDNIGDGIRVVRIRGDAVSNIGDGPDSSDNRIWSVRILADLEQGDERLIDIAVSLDYFGFGDLRLCLSYGYPDVMAEDILFDNNCLASIVGAMRDIGMTQPNAVSDPVIADVAAKASADIAEFLLNGPKEKPAAIAIDDKPKKGFFARLFGKG